MKDKEAILAVRRQTGAGLSLCKKAVSKSAGDVQMAVRWVASQGKAIADKKSARPATEGRLGSYVHLLDPKLGAMVDLACETDFAARTDQFIDLANDLAQQVVAYRPFYVDEKSAPEGKVASAKEAYVKAAVEEGKPTGVAERIAEGRLRKWREENCLLDQPWINDSTVSVREAIEESVASLKENIKVRGFVFISAGGTSTVVSG